LDDDVLDFVNRDCPTEKTVRAIKLLLDGGFKVDAHWMPDLPGSSYEKDRSMFEFLLSSKNEDFQVDQWKVYPTATVPYTRIKAWHEAGEYKPYAEVENGRLMVELLLYILKHCPYKLRLNRIIRDIPSDYISGGEKRVNLRQLLEQDASTRHIVCKDIRERECKGQAIRKCDSALFVDEFRASGGTEYYISVENMQRTILYGHLRLRLRNTEDANGAKQVVPALRGAALIRELHTYGKLLAVDTTNSGGEAQHVGVGTQLMRYAEELAARKGCYTRIAVIAGIGVRKYYEQKLGYRLEDTYMVKDITPASWLQRVSMTLFGT
jgi:elongator complex protein 3